MLRKLIKNKKAQNTAEYAILISLVVAGIIAMQTYAQRALQGRVRAAAKYMVTQTTSLGDQNVQYEPYYLETAYTVQRNDVEDIYYTNATDIRRDATTYTSRNGTQNTTYDETGLPSGI